MFLNSNITNKKSKRLTKINKEASTGEFLMIVASWSLGMKKTSADRKLPQKCHKNSHFIN